LTSGILIEGIESEGCSFVSCLGGAVGSGGVGGALGGAGGASGAIVAFNY